MLLKKFEMVDVLEPFPCPFLFGPCFFSLSFNVLDVLLHLLNMFVVLAVLLEVLLLKVLLDVFLEALLDMIFDVFVNVLLNMFDVPLQVIVVHLARPDAVDAPLGGLLWVHTGQMFSTLML